MGPKLACVRRAEHRCRPVHTSARRWLAPVQAARLWSPNTQEAITIALRARRAGLLLDLLRGAERR